MKVVRLRVGRFLCLLLIVFAASFFWASGDAILRFLVGKITLSPAPVPAITSTSSGSTITSGAVNAWSRLHRIFALKSAVEAKLNKKSYVIIDDIPLSLQQAIIAVEDNRYYQHSGFDAEGIFRAFLVNLQTGTVTEGGSTITQQLVKNLFLSHDRTLTRKLEEFVLSLDMEVRYSKEEILEMYLNTIYYGSGAYGIGEASAIYFGKPPASLSLPECAMLAGLPNSPSLTSPYVDFIAAKQRQAVVLTAMVRYGYISPGLAQEAKAAPLALVREK
ncbi:transglycosylase domain-containing protein [Methylomusa anaerophila]|uniref:Penicillin-binding protein 1F n=1 Tax=Methylomusa anaerophila TaxID=1930071 RepID=A0A348AK12_9FIRM|nr:penicillin-binding protein 1F [Methylomusa anaerophila]